MTSGDDAAPAPAPALRITDLTIKANVIDDAPATPYAPRDLPDLARFLFFALGAGGTERSVKILHAVSLDVEKAEPVALIGEDDAGKSTLARACARLIRPTKGHIYLDGVDIHARGAARDARRRLQVIFDDDDGCLDLRLTVRQSLALAHRALALGDDGDAKEERLVGALARARLGPDVLRVRAGDLTSGQRRRAGLARALLAEPAAVVVDEPTGGLDAFARAIMLDTYASLDGIALLILTRDLAAARTLGRRVGVLQRGRLVEIGDAKKVLDSPQHEYTQSLVAAAPRLRPPA